MPKITEMFAFVVADKDVNDEGVMAMTLPHGLVAPLVGADMTRIDSLRQHAELISHITGKPYKILHFRLIGEIK